MLFLCKIYSICFVYLITVVFFWVKKRCCFLRYFIVTIFMSNFSFNLVFPEKQGLGLKSFLLPEFSILESNDFSADQLCLRDNRRCTLPKLFVSELVSSKSALIFFRCEKIGIQRYFRKKQLWFRKKSAPKQRLFFSLWIKRFSKPNSAKTAVFREFQVLYSADSVLI